MCSHVHLLQIEIYTRVQKCLTLPDDLSDKCDLGRQNEYLRKNVMLRASVYMLLT